MAKYRIKALHFKNESSYFPQWKLLWFWVHFTDRKTRGFVKFTSKIRAQKFIYNYIDKINPKKEYIPYETLL
jgi:hypothetical protein